MKILSAYTYEIDDIETAIGEITSQLDIETSLEAHSAGIVTCYREFIDSGVVQALCAALPFEVVGCTTMYNGTERETGAMALALTVFTGDDVCFSTAGSTSIMDDQDAPLREAYQSALRVLDGSPKLIIPFIPLLGHVGGEPIVNKLNEISGGVPMFGTVACDHNLGSHDSAVIFRGKYAQDRTAMLLIGGNIDPKFFIATIPEWKMQKQKAIITKAHGNCIEQINEMPFLAYMKSLGLTQGDGLEALQSIPIMMDYQDGTKPIARAIYAITPEGHAVCGGEMPVGATLAIASIDYEDTLQTAQDLTGETLATGNNKGMLLFSCLSRNLVLGADMLAEFSAVSGVVKEMCPYQISYASGEICPVYDAGDRMYNYFHNFSMIACVF